MIYRESAEQLILTSRRDAGLRELMYDIFDLYEKPHDLKRPLIALDEKPKQLLKDLRKAISMKLGNLEKYNYGKEKD